MYNFLFNQYRIKSGGLMCECFIVQHKFLGLFWYKPLLISEYGTLKEAEITKRFLENTLY